MRDPAEDSLLARVGALTRQIAPRADPVGREPLAELTRRLDRPLQLAVAGEVSAGKSTLVNALLDRRIAMVLPSETAQATTVFRYAGQTRAWLTNAAGRRRVEFDTGGQLPLVSGGRLEVDVPAPLLTEVDLIDTPGLYSGDAGADHSERGRRALLGEDGRVRLAEAEATLFVFKQLPDKKVVDTLTALRRRRTAGAGGLDALAVFSVAGPSADASELTRLARVILGGLVAEVVPVNGQLAMAALPGALDDQILDLLTTLNRDGRPAPVRKEALAGPADRVFQLLGPYGAGWVAARLARDPDRATLAGDLRRRSGLPALLDAIRDRFLAHAPLLKAAAALSELDRLAATPAFAAPAVRVRLATGVRELLRHPSLHRLAEIRTRDRLAEEPGEPGGLGPESRRRLTQLLSPTTPAERLSATRGTSRNRLRGLAVREQRRWMTVAARDQALGRAERQAVTTALRTLTLLAHDLGDER